MGKKTKKGKTRLDKFYYLAKEQGFRSRAAFKLIQLNRQFHFLEKSRALLDLCAAPGGWLQVAAKFMPVGSVILGIDLVPIKPVRGVKTIVGDITTAKARMDIKKEAKGSLFDAVVHDGAPNVGGAWASEAYSQSTLVLDSLKLATEFLAPGGTFVTKIFRSKDYNSLLFAFNQLFDRVEATKPAASRNTSAEIFVCCLGFKAPAKIDARLLDHRHLFKEVADTPRNMGPDALMRQKIKQKRHREGYEEGLSLIHKPLAAAYFILSDRAVELLGAYTSLELDGPDSEKVPRGAEALEAADDEEEEGGAGGGGGKKAPQPQEVAEVAGLLREHASTDKEIRALCSDLQVLGRREFKQLLRWRLGVRKELERRKKAEAAARGEKEGGKEGEKKEGKKEGSEEDKLLEEMQSIKERLDAESKRERRKRKELKKKLKLRMMGGSKDAADTDFDQELFGLTTLRGKGALGLAEAEAPDSDWEGEEEEGEEESSEEEYDSEDERLRYEALTEAYLDEAYRGYKERKGIKDKEEGGKRRRLKDSLDLDDDVSLDGDVAPVAASDDELDRLGERGGGLLVKYDEGKTGRPTTSRALASRWFSQDLFGGAGGADGEVSDSDADDASDAEGEMSDRSGGEEEDEELVPSGGEEEEEEEAEDRDQSHVDRLRAARSASTSGGAGLSDRGGKKAAGGGRKGKVADAGFEVVPVGKSRGGDSDSDSEKDSGESDGTDADEEFEALPSSAKAEVLALAKKMIRGKDRQEILDAAYSRYAFHDSGLPQWFEEDEERHMRPVPLVTDQELADQQDRLKAVDARTTKKMAEAKARKKRRVAQRMSKARAKANNIADQEDVPMASRMKEIDKIYNKARREGKMDKPKKRRLDKRMKKELRATKRIEKKGGKVSKFGGKPKGGGGKGKGGSKMSKGDRRAMKDPRAGAKKRG